MIIPLKQITLKIRKSQPSNVDPPPNSPGQSGTPSEELTYLEGKCRICLCVNCNKNNNSNDRFWGHRRSHSVPVLFMRFPIYY